MKLKFEVYIGTDMLENKSKNIICKTHSKKYIPQGDLLPNGSYNKYNSDDSYFSSLDKLNLFFADMLDLCNETDLISAEIHLNIKSNVKIFKGYEIIKIIDTIKNLPDYKKLRSFPEL